MDRLKIYAASGIFLLLTLFKLLMPNAAANVRDKADELLGTDTDFAPVFEFISDKLNVETDEPAESSAPRPAEAAEDAEIVIRPVSLAARPELGEIQGERQPAVTVEAVELPEAVSAFLESQEEFSDYAIPASVTYSYSLLPFDYTVPVAGYESSGFGYRVHPIYGDVRFHYGTDIAAWSGESIQAFADGTVLIADYCDSYGNYVIIDHGDGWQSLYAHCSYLYVGYGQTVTKGETIALVGDTGQATGPHLHFELTQDGIYVNPEYYINDA